MHILIQVFKKAMLYPMHKRKREKKIKQTL